MTISLPHDKLDLYAARYHAASAAEHLFAAYWAVDRDDDTARYLLAEAHRQFAQMADILGYTVTQTADEAAAYRARQMNAELPADQAEVLKLKGMI